MGVLKQNPEQAGCSQYYSTGQEGLPTAIGEPG